MVRDSSVNPNLASTIFGARYFQIPREKPWQSSRILKISTMCYKNTLKAFAEPDFSLETKHSL